MSTIDELRSKFGGEIEISEISARRVFVSASPTDARAMVVFLFSSAAARLMTITSVDLRDGIELLYHMSCDENTRVVTVRTIVKKPELAIDSITPVIAGAEWVEREIHEMMGVNFRGHPNMKPLLLPEDWEQGKYPYRKKTFDSLSEEPRND